MPEFLAEKILHEVNQFHKDKSVTLEKIKGELPEEFEKYIGCARLITNLNSLFVTFAKYKHKSKVNPLLWDKMAEIGRSKGADPSEWYATFSPMSINNLDIEIFENGEWLSLKKGDG